MNKIYRIYKHDKNGNKDFLAMGVDKETAKEALRYAGYNHKKIHWKASSSFYGNAEFFEGEYIE